MTINEYCQRCIWNCNRYAPGDEIMCMFPKCVKYIKKATIIDKIDLSEGRLEVEKGKGGTKNTKQAK